METNPPYKPEAYEDIKIIPKNHKKNIWRILSREDFFRGKEFQATVFKRFLQ